MTVLEIIDAFRNGLMHVCLWALAALAVCALLLHVARRKQVRPVFAHIPPVPCVVLLAVMAVCTLFSGKNTNSPPAGIMLPILPGLTGGTPVVPVVVTPEDIARGHRLESVTTNDAVSYAMPTNGVEYAPWTLAGGRETHFALDLGDFAFPFGTGVVHRLDVLSGGMVESLPRQRVDGACYSSMMSICAAREWASIVPGVGRFWWADAAGTAGLEAPPYRMKLLTWEDVYGERDRTGQYSAQIELRDDGNFITRSNNVESVYRRVHPHDLDNDGLPNIIDPSPELPIVPSAWNQSEAWAEAAFPSNAADIASAGGYASWAAARGADPDRRLVSLGITFDDGSAWPALLDFDGIPVMVNGRENLAFAIDCGAKVPFSLTAGRLGSVSVTATEPPMRSGEGLTSIESHIIQKMLNFPHERSVGDVWLHLDSPRFGWLCRTASVSIEPSWLPHFFPGDSAELTATVSDCHPNAYLGCMWTGGAGLQFSDEHSLSTTVTYDSESTVEWATNGIDLITQFVGYTLTNHVHFTVGTTNVPPLQFSLGCQEVFFLNDADFLEGGCPSNRPERIRPVSLSLTGPLGTNGTARLSVQGNVAPVLFHVVDGVTNRVTSETTFPLAVTNDISYTGSYTIYMSCPNLGTGTITATFTPEGGGDSQTNSVTFRCIEPLRKLVTTEKVGGRYVNPSRLIMGTNAVLKVGVNGIFSPSEVDWRLISGSADVVPNGWCATVTPTGLGTVTVEARFNDDEIQPRFVLPVVDESVLHVRAFAVKPHESLNAPRWDRGEIEAWFQTANEIYSQVGVRFVLDEMRTDDFGMADDWNVLSIQTRELPDGSRLYRLSDQVLRLLNAHASNDCIKVVFSGAIKSGNNEVAAFTIPIGYPKQGVFIGRKANQFTLAHELGHALGLEHCFSDVELCDAGGSTDYVYIEDGQLPVTKNMFPDGNCDWGLESGRGFYSTADVRSVVIERLVMLGVGGSGKADIPDGRIISLTPSATNSASLWYPKVGARYLQTDERKVYAHEK